MLCFSQGKSSGNHKPWHDYRIVEQHAYPIFDEDWGADEELFLIEGMKSHGVGNWQDIADHIGGRSKEEVEQHYKKVYLESETYPVPNLKRKFSIDPSEFAERRRQRIEDRRAKSRKLLPPKQKPTASVPSCHEVQGYMPGRLEFETEYENEAEMSVKDMIFDPEDNETEVELKLTVLDIYNSRLTSRAERKRVMLDHGLLEYRKNVALDKKRSKEEKDILNSRIRVFARLLTPEDYQQFATSVLTELQCRRRIAELQEYRRNGLRTFSDAQKYETDKAVRLATLSLVASHGGNGSGGGNGGSGGGNGFGGNGNGGGSRFTANSMAAASSSRYAAGLGSSGRAHHGATSGHTDLHATNHHHIIYGGNGRSGAATPHLASRHSSVPVSAAAAAAAAASGRGGSATPIPGSLGPDPDEIAAATAARLASLSARLFRKPAANPLDISKAADVELLSPEEQMLCSQLRILPKPYLAIKETLFRELLKSGGVLKKRTARELIKIDVNKTARIYEFFRSQRWIS